MDTTAEHRIYAVQPDASGKISLQPVWTQTTNRASGSDIPT